MSDKKNKKPPENIFRQHGGQLRMSEAIQYGISRYTLYKMRDNGALEQFPEVSIAVSRDTRTPSLDYPPVHVYKFSTEAFESGIEKRQIDGVTVQIYSAEKTLADCFKYRNKLGMDVVLEALKLYRSQKKINMDKLLKYARVCRIEKLMRPYLDSSL